MFNKSEISSFLFDFVKQKKDACELKFFKNLPWKRGSGKENMLITGMVGEMESMKMVGLCLT